MGVFEKSIPRYVYNPIQRNVVPAPQDYYVDDIWDPIFNKNVKAALAAKYGNPVLGTMMGYYEGIENALAGQKNGKWGILGPGMGILSGFGRSVDKADDVILGTLTEGVKSVSGQGFESPLENIFVNDQDYTGRRLLAAMANSMSKLAGGTTVSEEDFGGAYGPVSLGIELATDPTIMGKSLQKLSTAPKLVESLGRTSGRLGDVGRFLEKYDDVVTRASIDLTAPGLRPAIKGLLSRLHRLTGGNKPAKFVDVVQSVQNAMDNPTPENVKLAKAAQAAIKNDPDAQTALGLADELTTLDKKIVAAQTAAGIPVDTTEMPPVRGVYKHVREAADADVDTIASVKRNTDKRIVDIDREIKSMSDENVRNLNAAFQETEKRAKWFINKNNGRVSFDQVQPNELGPVYKDLLEDYFGIRIDGNLSEWLDKPTGKTRRILHVDPRRPSETALNSLVAKTTDMQYHSLGDVQMSGQDLYELYKKELDSKFNTVETVAETNADKYASDPGFLQHLKEKLDHDKFGEPNNPPGYQADFGPTSWLSGRFSENNALNNQIRDNVLGYWRYEYLPHSISLSPSEIGTSNKAVPKLAERGELEIGRVAIKNTILGTIPEGVLDSKKAAEEFFASDEWNKTLETVIPDEVFEYDTHSNAALRNKLTGAIKRVLHNPETYNNKPYTQYNVFQDMRTIAETLTGNKVDRSALERLENPHIAALAEEISKNPIEYAVDRGIFGNYPSEKFLEAREVLDVPDRAFSNFIFDSIYGRYRDTTYTPELLMLSFDLNKEQAESVISAIEYIKDQSLYWYDNPILSEVRADLPEFNDFFKKYTVGDERHVKLSAKSIMETLDLTDKDTARVIKEAIDDARDAFSIRADEELEFGKIFKQFESKKPLSDYLTRYIVGDRKGVPFDKIAFANRFDLDIERDKELVDYVENYVDSIRTNVQRALNQAKVAQSSGTIDFLRDLRDEMQNFEEVSDDVLMLEHATYDAGAESLDKQIGNDAIQGTAEDESITFADAVAGSTLVTDSQGNVYEKSIERAPIGIRHVNKQKGESLLKSYTTTLQELIALNPEIFLDHPERLEHVYRPMQQWLQLKLKRPLYDVMIDVGESVPVDAYDIAWDFEKKCLPDLQKAASEGILPWTKAFAEKYPETAELLEKPEMRYIMNNVVEGKGVYSKYGNGWKPLSHELAYHNFKVNHPDIIERTVATVEGKSTKLFPKKFNGKKVVTALNAYHDAFVNWVTTTNPDTVAKRLSEEFLESKTYDPASVEFIKKFLKTDPQRLAEELFEQTDAHALLKILQETPNTTTLKIDSPWRKEIILSLQNRHFQQPLFEFEKAQTVSTFGQKGFGVESFYDNLYQTSRIEMPVRAHGTPPKIPKTQRLATRALDAEDVIAKASPEVVADTIENPPTAAQTVIENMLPPEHHNSTFTAEAGFWHWGKQIESASAVHPRAMGLAPDKYGETARATLRIKSAKDVIQEGLDLHTVKHVKQSSVKKCYALMAAQAGDTLKGANFVHTMLNDTVIRAPFKTQKAANEVAEVLKHNVALMNGLAESEVAQVTVRKMSNGNFEVIAQLNTKNTDAVAKIERAYKRLKSAQFEDVVFMKPHKLTTEHQKFLASEEAQSILQYLRRLQELAQEHARRLGYQFDPSEYYLHHTRNVDGSVADYVANDLNNGIALDDLDDMATQISNSDVFGKEFHGVFGTNMKGRRYRGAYWLYDTPDKELFTYQLDKIAKGTLSEGVFANSNYQSFVETFYNDNFKIKGVFESVDDFKNNFLYAGGYPGKSSDFYSGNLYNIDLCAPKYDATGKIVGIKKYDVFSDTELAKALSDENTILVPANVVDTFDKILRKEKRLSNRFYAFFNKHFTIPFKFGVLTNPGFLIGNISDAYLKQATTMSQKYGTSMTEELANVEEAARTYLNLGNSYNAAIDHWKKHMESLGIELTAPEQIPEVLAGHSPSRKRLMDYLNYSLKGPDGNFIVPELSEQEAGTILLWHKLQQIMHSSNSLREFDDLADAIGKSKYHSSRNIVDRVFQGSGQYSGRNPSTWGAFINNPISNTGIKCSEFIESTMRGTAILNDLYHSGYTNEEIFKILTNVEASEAKAFKTMFEMDYADAVNAMYAANFNYERSSDFMEKVGNVMPFPVFYLKNLVYWLELFVKNPKYFDHAISIQENLWANKDTSKDEFVAEAKGRGAVPVNGQKLSKFFKGIYKPTPLQSMFSAFETLNRPAENISYRLHPLITGGTQTVNKVLPGHPLTTVLGEAKYRPYSTNPYERNISSTDPNFNPLTYTLHHSNPYERTVNTLLRTPKKVAQKQAQLSDFLPSVFQPDFSKK